jgi:hypothetical protein
VVNGQLRREERSDRKRVVCSGERIRLGEPSRAVSSVSLETAPVWRDFPRSADRPADAIL